MKFLSNSSATLQYDEEDINKYFSEMVWIVVSAPYSIITYKKTA